MSRHFNLILICAFTLLFTSLAYSVDEDSISRGIKQAYKLLSSGKYDKALETIAPFEPAINAEKDTEPGRIMNILIVKSRAYIFKDNGAALETFLSEFEREHAYDTSSRGSSRFPLSTAVPLATCRTRKLWYRTKGDLPRAMKEHEKLIILYLEAIRKCGKNKSREFNAHVELIKERGDLYRLMGNIGSAKQDYEKALAYLKANPGLLVTAESRTNAAVTKDLYYVHELLPELIEQCSYNPSEACGILYQKVAWQTEEGDFFLNLAQAYKNSRMSRLALESYQQAQQVLELHNSAFGTLLEEDKERSNKLQEKLSEKIRLLTN